MSLLLLIDDEENDVIPTYTWAAKPASAQAGVKIRISDIGPASSEWISDGTNWLPVNGHVLIARSGAAAALTGTVTETALATITIPAAAMGTNGQVRVRAFFSNNNSANNKTMRIKFGGLAGTAYRISVNSTNLTQQLNATISNANSASAQTGFGTAGSDGASSSAPITSSVNTASDTTVVISAQLANSGDTCTLESYSVELLR